MKPSLKLNPTSWVEGLVRLSQQLVSEHEPKHQASHVHCLPSIASLWRLQRSVSVSAAHPSDRMDVEVLSPPAPMLTLKNTFSRLFRTDPLKGQEVFIRLTQPGVLYFAAMRVKARSSSFFTAQLRAESEKLQVCNKKARFSLKLPTVINIHWWIQTSERLLIR